MLPPGPNVAQAEKLKILKITIKRFVNTFITITTPIKRLLKNFENNTVSKSRYCKGMSKYKIGHGWDLHRLEPYPPKGNGCPFLLGGIHIETDEYGPVGHSDADVLLHAIIDSLCGAMGTPDLGDRFPPTDPQWKNVDSAILTQGIIDELISKKLKIEHIDCTIILEKPNLKIYKEKIRSKLSKILNIPIHSVGVKAKSREGTEAKNSKSVEAHSVVLLTDEP